MALMHIKDGNSFIIRKMKIKTTMRFFSLIIIVKINQCDNTLDRGGHVDYRLLMRI